MEKTNIPGWFKDGNLIVNKDQSGLARVKSQRNADKERQILIDRLKQLETRIAALESKLNG